MSIETEKWVVDADGDVWLEGYGQFGLRAQCPSPKYGYPDVAGAIAVLPEALAALKDAAQYDHDGLCWGIGPCPVGNHDERCLRNRDILRRAGVLP